MSDRVAEVSPHSSVRVEERDGNPVIVVANQLEIRLDVALHMEMNGELKTMDRSDLDATKELLTDGAVWTVETPEHIPDIEITPTVIDDE